MSKKGWQDNLTASFGEQFGSIGTIGGTATGTIHAAAVGTIINVTDFLVSSEGAATVTLGDGTPTVVLTEVKMKDKENNIPISGLRTPIKTTKGSALVYNAGGGTVAVTVTGFLE